MGLPTLVINIAENQQDISESLACVGAIVNLGDAENITVEKIAQSITSYFENPVRLKKMSEIGMNLVDGMGAQRVAEEVQIYKYKSTIVSDANSWMNDYIPSFIPYLQKQGHFVTWVHEVSDIEAGDFAFYLGCGQITPESILQRNRHNLVVHGSALPQGKGWSPLTWQILEGKNEIPMTLFEAVPEVDSGPIYIQETMKFRGDELIDELREEQADCSFRLIQQFLRRYPNILKEGRQQTGSSSYYRRRTPEDSKLDPEKSIIEQFNLLRVVDNDRYPAFFEKDGYRYVIKIEKMKE